MIRMLVGRLHVSASNIDVIRYVRSKLIDPRQESMDAKKELYREAIKEHADNKQLYYDVMY